ncbi:hypothetical protein H6G04_27185 [Calothrix membranacea FACHB-236]|nr:hypothetical protein [Calothrix membranacea FACHB-236]
MTRIALSNGQYADLIIAADQNIGGNYPLPNGQYAQTVVPVDASGNVITTIPVLHPGYESGLYYGPFFVGTTSSYTLLANTIYYQFTYIPRDVTISGLAINVTTASSGASMRLGIYSVANGNASSLIVDAGTVSIGTTGQKDAAFSRFLAAGWYAFTSTASAAGGVVTGAAPSAANFPFVGLSGVQTYGGIGKSGAFTYGSLPSTAPTAYSGSSNVPVIWFKT